MRREIITARDELAWTSSKWQETLHALPKAVMLLLQLLLLLAKKGESHFLPGQHNIWPALLPMLHELCPCVAIRRTLVLQLTSGVNNHDKCRPAHGCVLQQNEIKKAPRRTWSWWWLMAQFLALVSGFYSLSD